MIDRITRIERIFDNLTIRGPGWSGDSEQGFMFNPIPIEEALPQLVIPCDKIMTVTFHGVTFPLGCSLVSWSSQSFQFIYTVTNFNDIPFVQTNIPFDYCLWSYQVPGNMHVNGGQWDTEGCSGSFTPNQLDYDLFTIATFQNGIFRLRCYNGGTMAFYGTANSGTSPVVMNNLSPGFNQDAAFSDNTGSGSDMFWLGFGGTATITF